MIDWTYRARSDLASKVDRRIKRWRNVSPVEINCNRPIVTFTFDDFPKSALNGADIVEKRGGRAGFYACTSMAGHTGPYGERFDEAMLAELQERDHEIGAHTNSHLDVSRASTEQAVADIDENLTRLKEMGLERDVTSFAYPFGETRLSTRADLIKRFHTCRGVAPGVNAGRIDRSHLRAFELNGCRTKFQNAVGALESLKQTPGWVIIFTHDVSTDPTEFGVAIQDLEDLCDRAEGAGAALMSPTSAAQAVGVPDL